MWMFILIAAIAWIVGVFGWAQIIGCMQNILTRKGMIFPMVLWIVIMGMIAYFAIVKFDALWALLIGYGISFVQVLSAGKIQ